jgi:hypothetical protein
MGWLLPSRLGVESAEVTVAVRLERTHAQLLGQGERLAVMSGSLVEVRGGTMRGNLAEEAQGICLDTPFLVLAGRRQCMLGEGVRSLQATSQQLCLA